MTCATPGMVSSRGRMMKSAISRTFIGDTPFGRRHRDEQDLPHDRVDRAHLRGDVGRQLALHERQPLGDLLAVAEDLRVPVELDIDDRQSDAGHRAHAGDARQPVHLRLDRDR